MSLNNTCIPYCLTHCSSENLIIKQQSFHRGNLQVKYCLICPQCYANSSAFIHIQHNQIRSEGNQANRGVYLCEQSKQYFQDWTSGLIDILTHLQSLQSSQTHVNTNQKFAKLKSIFTIPQFLLNKTPENIIKIFNAVLNEQIKLLEGNLHFIAAQKYDNLNNKTFLADLYNIIFATPQYSINILLQKFKSLVKEYYMSLGMKISDQYIKRIELGSKLKRKLAQFKQNMLRKYGKQILYRQNNTNEISSKSMKLSESDILSIQSEELSPNPKQKQREKSKEDSMIQSDVVEKKIIVGSERGSLNSTQRKIKSNEASEEQRSKAQNHPKKQISIEQKIDNSPQRMKSDTKSEQKSKQQKFGSDLKMQQVQPFKTPKNQKMPNEMHNSVKVQHCRTQKTPQKDYPSSQRGGKQAQQSTITKIHTLQSEQSRGIYPQVYPKINRNNINLAVSEIFVPGIRPSETHITSKEMVKIIDQLSKQNHNLKNLKEDIVHEVESISNVVNWLKITSQNTLKSDTFSDIGNNNASVPKQKYDMLQKQYLIALHQVSEQKHNLQAKKLECELLKKQIQQENMTKAKNYQNIGRRYSQDVHMQQKQLENEQEAIKNLSIFNQQLIEKINKLENEISQHKSERQIKQTFQQENLHIKSLQFLQKQQQLVAQIQHLHKINSQYNNIIENKNKIIEQLEQSHIKQRNLTSLQQQHELVHTKQVQKMRNEQQRLKNEIDRINYDIEQMLIEKLQSQFNIERYKEDIENKNRRIKELEKEIEEVYQQNIETNEKYHKLLEIHRNKQGNQQKIQELFNQLRQNQNTISVLKQKIRALEEQLEYPVTAPMTHRSDNIRKLISFNQSQSEHQVTEPEQYRELSTNEYEDIIGQLKKQLGEKIIQIESYSIKLQQLQQSSKQAKQQLQKFTIFNENLQKCIEQMTEKYQKEAKQHQEQIKIKCIENKQQQQKIEQLMGELKEFNERNKSMRIQLQRLYQQMIGNINRQLQQMKKEKEIYKRISQNLELEKQKLEEKYENDTENMERMKKQIQEMQKEMEDKDNKILEISNKAKDLQRQKQEQAYQFKAEMQNKNNAMKEILNKCEELQAKIKQILSESAINKEFQYKNKQLKQELAQFKQKLMKNEARIKQANQMALKIENLTKENERLKQIINSCEIESEVQKYEIKRQSSTENKVSLQIQVENLRNTIANLQQKQSSYDEEMMEELILTQSRLKSKQFEVDKIMNICYEILDQIEENRREKYLQMLKSWKAKV